MDPICEALILLSSAFGGGMSSRLFQRIREEMALAYSVFAYQSFYSQAGIIGVYVGTRPENSNKALDSILAEYSLLHKEGLMALELEQIKAQIKGQMIISMESTGARLMRLAGHALRGEPYKKLEESLAQIDAVTLDEVNETCTRFLDPEDQYVMSMGP
jgi:predicted Zn-dependent peptidase